MTHLRRVRVAEVHEGVRRRRRALGGHEADAVLERAELDGGDGAVGREVGPDRRGVAQPVDELELQHRPPRLGGELPRGVLEHVELRGAADAF